MTLSFFRHPELVSGSISPLARCMLEKHNREAGLKKVAFALSARWILKQVQDDGVWVSGDGMVFGGVSA